MILFAIYIFTILAYFKCLRSLLLKDAFESINPAFVVMSLFLGFMPILNIIAVICLTIGYYIASNNLTAKDVLKKILFIK